MSTDSDRRAHPRITVELRVDEHHDTATYFQQASDLSVGGLHLAGTISHPEGTRVSLELHLPGTGAPVRVEAEVVSEPGDPIGMHLRFVDLDPDARERIERFIAARRTD